MLDIRFCHPAFGSYPWIQQHKSGYPAVAVGIKKRCRCSVAQSPYYYVSQSGNALKKVIDSTAQIVSNRLEAARLPFAVAHTTEVKPHRRHAFGSKTARKQRKLTMTSCPILVSPNRYQYAP